MLNKDIAPPDVDMRYKPLFDNEKEEIGSPLYELVSLLLINSKPLPGCQMWGETCVVAYMYVFIINVIIFYN